MSWRPPSRIRRAVAKQALQTAEEATRTETAQPVDEEAGVEEVGDVDAANSAIRSTLRRQPTSVRQPKRAI